MILDHFPAGVLNGGEQPVDLLDHALVVHARRLVVARQGHLAGELEKKLETDIIPLAIHRTTKTVAWAENGDGGRWIRTLVFSQMSETESAILFASCSVALKTQGEERSPPFEKSKRSLVVWMWYVNCSLGRWPPPRRWSVFNC